MKKNTLVSVVSSFEILMADLLKHHFIFYPEALSLENKSISFENLRKFKKINEIENYLIENEIRSILFDGVFSKIDVFNKKIGITFFEDNKSSWFYKDLEKIFRIRNLIVHNGGKMDKSFIKDYGSKKDKDEQPIKLTDEFLLESIYLIYVLGLILLQEFQLKFVDEKVDLLVTNELHWLVRMNQFKLADELFSYIKKNLISFEKDFVMSLINYCILLKKQSKDTDMYRILFEYDWDSKIFNLDIVDSALMCKAALENKDKVFYGLLEKQISEGVLTTEQLNEWCIFDFYSKKPKFIKIKNSLKKQKPK